MYILPQKIVYENAYVSCICSQILCGGAEEILGSPITKIWEVRLRGIHWLVQDPWGSCLNADVSFSRSARAPRLCISKLSRAMLGVDRPQPWMATRQQQDWLRTWFFRLMSKSPREFLRNHSTLTSSKEKTDHWESDRLSSSPWID